MKQRVLSGMRPSGKLHLGHLHGALSNWVELQKNYECFYFVADWHALTTEYEKTDKIKQDSVDMVIDWLSVGLDPEKSTIFVQSKLLEHAELHLLLSMITPLSWLERCPTYKEQLKEIKTRDIHTYGFLGYPVLQAADILIYKADNVPVGEDQLPHLELTREIARRFNSFYGNVLIEPKALLTKTPRIPGTDGRKMSKSYNNCIYLSDTPEIISKKISSYITDPARIHATDMGHPDICGIFPLQEIYCENHNEIAENCKKGTIGCVKCKKLLAEKIIKSLEPIHKKQQEIKNNRHLINDVLHKGNQKAKVIVEKTMLEVRKSLKLWNME
ncbi:MAG TPA: tryptophan--tRNA ligase [Elusimicrobia bacterium]|nr:MAG: tryptophan--tRNA ligase [Elusimicrobia bacterium RIFOXYD2_FULL_34_30]HAM37930.1 tryptophan--tRNA ligase [Elusimicrobiota bacterium]